MSTATTPSDIPDTQVTGTASPGTGTPPSLYEKVRGMENAMTKGFLSQLEQPWNDRRLLVETATRALEGDRSAQQVLSGMLADYVKTTSQTLQDFTQPKAWQQLAEEKLQDIHAIRQAYAREDFETAAQLTGIAIAGMTDRHRTGAHHHGEPIEWENRHPPRHTTDSSQGFTLSQGETVQIGNRTFTHEDNVEHITVRAPLHDAELVPIDHDALAPRPKPRAAEMPASTGNGVLTNVGIVTGVAGLGYAGYEAHQHISHGDRPHNVELSVAYKATMQLVENQSAENRQALYGIALKQHPELYEAFAGYEFVRTNLTKDGVLNQRDQSILNMVVFNTNLTILDGKLSELRGNSPEFTSPEKERSEYNR